MQRLICVIGNKGGTGKTTVTHMLCHGLGLLGWRSIAILTDTHRQPLAKEGRRYVPLDGRDPDALEKIVAKLETTPDWLGIIDGGGNRPALDQQFYERSGMALLPFRDSPEDIRTVMDDLAVFPDAFGLPSQWPTNPWQQSAAERAIDEIMLPLRQRILKPVYAISASKQLLQVQAPGNLPSALNNTSRALARQVLAKLGLTRDTSKESHA